MKEIFLAKFSEVFDENGRIKCCGREKCKELIQSAIDFLDSDRGLGIPREKLGNINTGVINESTIKVIHEYALSH